MIWLVREAMKLASLGAFTNDCAEANQAEEVQSARLRQALQTGHDHAEGVQHRLR
ncbi:hypothetical protein D3C76_1869500 [compost metagenome]